jgi:WD40 repeat protein
LHRIIAVGAYRLFLSHAGIDTEAARALMQRIESSPAAREARLSVWFDKRDLVPGSGWQAQIEQALTKDATAFAVYVGSKGVVNWVENEVRLALSRSVADDSFPFIPILAKESVGSSALPPFARQYHATRDPLNDLEEFAKFLKAVLGQGASAPVVTTDTPFVGLRPMDEDWADRFFGRDEGVEELADKLKAHRLVAIVADSGAGKSSLTQAGFIPAFRGGALAETSGREPDDRIWHVVVMRPGSDPLQGLKNGVNDAAERLGFGGDVRASLRKRVDPADVEETAFALRCDLPRAKTETLLIIDQFEELLTQTPPDKRHGFVDLVMELVDGSFGFRCLLTIRADHYNLCSPFEKLFGRLQRDNQAALLRLKRISSAGLAAAVGRPLRMAGHTDEAETHVLIGAIERDMSDHAGDLALVQMALRSVWDRRALHGGDLLQAYTTVNGIAGALAYEAEAVRKKLSPDDQKCLLPIFVRLVRLGETGGATRRTAHRDEFYEAKQKLITFLSGEEGGRLFVTNDNTVEIAHEALFTQWPWLQDELQRASRDVRVLDRLMEKAARWAAADTGQQGKHLASGTDREEFSTLRNDRANWLSVPEIDFVESSDAAFQKEGKRRKALVLSLSIATTVSVAALGLGWGYFQTARSNLSAALTALSSAESERNPVESIKYALVAWSKHPNDDLTRRNSTIDAISEATLNFHERLRFYGHGHPVTSAAFSPDGARVVTTSSDKTARVWDAQTGVMLKELKGHDGAVASAAFSPDGARVVTASEDKTARIWDAQTGVMLKELKGHDGAVTSAAFSPDGARVVTASEDKCVRLWNAQTGLILSELRGHARAVASATFSWDGARIVTASEDNSARLWDAQTGAMLKELNGHVAPVFSAAFSPDGERVVTASFDNAVRVWDTRTSTVLKELRGHDGPVQTAAFSPDGARIVTASWDKTARVWDARTGLVLMELAGHDGTLNSATFSQDGTRIVTASWDKTARIWDANTGAIKELLGHGDVVTSVAFSPVGARLVTASSDKTARVWDMQTGTVLKELKGHAGVITSAAFSPDGARVVTASRDKTARVWDAQTGVMLKELKGHDGVVNSAAFSPDGARVVTASEDKTGRIWDAQTGVMLKELKGHEGALVAAAFSPDGGRVVTASFDKTASIWDSQMAAVLKKLKGHVAPVFSAAFSSDGAHIVTASSDKTARVWDAQTGTAIRKLKGHAGAVFSAAFSSDGARVITASSDKTARVWDAQTGAAIKKLKAHDGAVTSAAFSPDGTQVVTSSTDKTARLWDLSTLPNGNVFEVACTWLTDKSLEGLGAKYGLKIDQPICEQGKHPPLPQLPMNE